MCKVHMNESIKFNALGTEILISFLSLTAAVVHVLRICWARAQRSRPELALQGWQDLQNAGGFHRSVCRMPCEIQKQTAIRQEEQRPYMHTLLLCMSAAPWSCKEVASICVYKHSVARTHDTHLCYVSVPVQWRAESLASLCCYGQLNSKYNAPQELRRQLCVQTPWSQLAVCPVCREKETHF